MDGNYSKTMFVSNGSKHETGLDPNWPYVPIQPKQGLILFLITFSGISANLVAFLATMKLVSKQRSAINYLIIALSITDTYGIVFCTLPTLLCYLKREWIGGLAMCNFQGVSTMFASLASGSLATAMAMERLFAIWKPFLYREIATKRKTTVTIIFLLLTALIIALFPLAKKGNFIRNLTGTYCTINWFAKHRANVAYAIFYAVMGAIMIAIVLFCNISIAVRLLIAGRNRKMLRADSTQQYLVSKKLDVENQGDEKDNGKTKDKVRKKKFLRRSRSTVEVVSSKDSPKTTISLIERQLAKTVAVISVLFVICWAPFIIRIICNLTGVWVDAWVDVQVSRLLLINFVLDPFLYTLSRKQCRDIVKKWFCCCCLSSSHHRYSFFSRLTKKRGSFLSSSQSGSGQNINSTAITTTSNVQLVHMQTSSANTSADHLVIDAAIHSKAGKSEEEAVSGTGTTNAKNKEDDEKLPLQTKHVKRLHSEFLSEDVIPLKEKTLSLPNLVDKQKETENEDVEVNVGMMYSLAFQRQNSSN